MRDDVMFLSIATFYLFLKVAFFFSLVRIQVKFDTMKDHWLFLGILYTSAAGFLFFVFLSWMEFPWPDYQRQVARNLGVQPWQSWLGETFLVATLYFRLMAKFDDGVIFWTLLLLGVPLVWFF
jgi:hypothetical protein